MSGTRNIPWLALLPPVIFGALVVMFLTGMFRDDPDALPSTLIGRAAPVLDLDVLPGKPVLTADQINQPGAKIVNYWASWCGPCRVEHPLLMDLAAEGAVVHGVNYKDDPANAARFLDDLGDPYLAIGTDRSGRNGFNWGVYGIPETFVLDGEGKVVLRFAGPLTPDVLEAKIRPALALANGLAQLSSQGGADDH